MQVAIKAGSTIYPYFGRTSFILKTTLIGNTVNDKSWQENSVTVFMDF